jgi:hypothetical protein
VSIGATNDVGRAHSKAIPSSQETSMNSAPGRKRPRSSFITNMSGASVSWRMQLTTMSCSARTSTSGADRRRPCASVRPGWAGSGANWSIRTSAKRASTAATGRWVSTDASATPSADRARMAPRAVAPKLMTAALRGRP